MRQGVQRGCERRCRVGGEKERKEEGEEEEEEEEGSWGGWGAGGWSWERNSL